MTQYVTTTCVYANKRLRIEGLDDFNRSLASKFVDGQELVLTIEEEGRKRTSRQNRFLHGPVCKAFRELGWDDEYTKTELCLRFLPVEHVQPDGSVVIVPGHTSTLLSVQRVSGEVHPVRIRARRLHRGLGPVGEEAGSGLMAWGFGVAAPKPEPLKTSRARKKRTDAQRLKAWRDAIWTREREKDRLGVARCQSCGIPVFRGNDYAPAWRLGECDHIIPRSLCTREQRYDPANAMLVCQQCHADKHAHKIHTRSTDDEDA